MEHKDCCRHIAIVIIMLCMMCLSSMQVQAAKIVDKGKWGDNITWTLDDEGTITFSGKGKMKKGTTTHEMFYEDGGNSKYEMYTWAGYLLDIKKIVIKEGITNVPSFAFCYMYSYDSNPICKVVSVELPSSIKTIDRGAFYRCKKLKNINLPSNLKIIGDYAFDTCIALKKMVLPKNLKEIGKYAFYNCRLEKIVLPNNLKKIGRSAFAWCEKLKTIEIPSKVKSIGSFAFQNCTSLETVKFKSNKNKTLVVGSKCFYNCTSLKTVVFPNNVKELRFTFKNCSSLESVKLPKNLEVMAGTFSKCSSLEKITIPAKVKQLDDETFYKCKNLKKIVIKSEKLNFENAYKPHVTYKGIAKDAWILIPASKYDLYKKNIMLSAPETVRIKGR